MLQEIELNSRVFIKTNFRAVETLPTLKCFCLKTVWLPPDSLGLPEPAFKAFQKND